MHGKDLLVQQSTDSVEPWGQVWPETAPPVLLLWDVGLLSGIFGSLPAGSSSPAVPPLLHPALHWDLPWWTVLCFLPDVLRLHQRCVGGEERER